MKIIIPLAFFVAFLTCCQCDLPVHCLKHQIVGKWKLFIGGPQLQGVGQVPCGHSIPDSEMSSYQADYDNFNSQVTMEVELEDSNVLTSDGEMGTWTMVYDEGFEMKVGNTVYFAFSKYVPNNYQSTSYCDQTLIGWYNNLQKGDRGCYYAQRSQEYKSFLGGDKLNIDPYFSSLLSTKSKMRGYLMTSQHHKNIVDQINNDHSLKWKAFLYSDFLGISFKELNEFSGRRNFYQGEKEKEQSKKRKYSFLQYGNWNFDDDYSYNSDTYKSNDYDDDNSQMPTEFSWKEYLDTPRHQKKCGSCYTIATISMLSARLKIKGEQVTLSPQHSLNCNYYTQGCNGGYAYLVQKYASENYLITEEAEPYKARTGECDMSKLNGLSKAYKVSSYRYVGGAYGKSNERLIMEEIKQNGPVVLSFEPGLDFQYYKSGIYETKNLENWDVLGKMQPEWYFQKEKTDHSILCYGWGEENGEKFWLLQNSWGENWGENGYFRMKRGVDESNIESMAEAADPIVVNLSNQGLNYVSESSSIQPEPKYHIDVVEAIFSFNQKRAIVEND